MNKQLLLPQSCTLRQASAQDIWQIRKLVLSEKLDPTQVRWQQFWIIECDGKIIGCGQLRQFREAQELSSLIVVPAWRKQGLGTALTQHLIQSATQPLYLECLGEKLARFYTNFGFVAVSWQELPQSLKLKFGLPQLARKILGIPVIIMHYQPQSL